MTEPRAGQAGGAAQSSTLPAWAVDDSRERLPQAAVDFVTQVL